MERAVGAVLVAGCLLAGSAASDEYYTCRMADGRIEMRDHPCPAGAKTLPTRPGRVTVTPRPAGVQVVPGVSKPASRAPGPSVSKPHPVKATPFVDPDWDAGYIERMLLRARFAGVLSALHNLRTASMMYNAEYGSWPASAEDMGLDGSSMQTNEIADVRFIYDGTILAALKPSFGERRFVAMMPVEELGGAQLGWKCAANFPKSFLGGTFGASCESRTIEMSPPRPEPGT